MKPAEMATESILEELRDCALELDDRPAVQRRLLGLIEEVKVRIESLELDIQEMVDQRSFDHEDAS